ncbi:MAG: hypothetical protein HY459_04640 [Parcubacteria group bacterium]|nr:hypothetical protein [Parcubacteria group bacterium]
MKEDWEKEKVSVPPVLIVISNRAETADRIEYAIKQGHTAIKELEKKEGLLVIHQSALDKLENEDDESMQRSKKDLAVDERERFNSVGKEGKPGEKVQCVIGVNMLSEGWDARTVTHILGVRAFTSQLLCEQVIGRGLRRLSYELNAETGMFDPEYVTVFGVPFTYLPVEQQSGKVKPEAPKTKIQPLEDRKSFEVRWPHVLRVEYKLSYLLDLDWDKLNTLTLSPQDAPTVVEVAPVIDGKPDYKKINEVDLKRLAESNRLQSMKLRAAALLHKKFEGTWPGDPGSHVSQIVDIIEKFITSGKLQLKIPMFENTALLEQVVLALNMQKITEHVAGFIRSSSNEEPMAVFDSVRPVRSTATAPTWYTSKPVQPTKKSQISHIVMDSRWEALASEFDRERIPGLVSWAKNDHLGLEIYYFWQGETHIYYPDFIIKFEGNRHLILEVKGREDDKTKAKHLAAEEWIRAVNAYGNLGTWEFKVLRDPKDLFEIVK